MRMEIFLGISVDPGIRFGKPCLSGTRLDVATIIDALGAGNSYEEGEQAYRLTHEQTPTAPGPFFEFAADVAGRDARTLKACGLLRRWGKAATVVQAGAGVEEDAAPLIAVERAPTGV